MLFRSGLAVVMPAVFTYTMKHDVTRFAQIANRVWNCEMDFNHPENTAMAGIRALAGFLTSLGMPKNFEELGAKKSDIAKLAHTACFGNGGSGTISGFTTLTEKDVIAIYELM